MQTYFYALLVVFFTSHGFAYSWQKGEMLPEQGMPNPYNESTENLQKLRREGLIHTLYWPVEITGALIPYLPLKTFNLIDNLSEMLGLNPYPQSEGTGEFYVPFKGGQRPEYKMGLTFVERHGAQGVTFSCTACHSATLFGKQIIGLTNRFPRSNHVVGLGVKWTRKIQPETYKALVGADEKDLALYTETRNNLHFVESKEPLVLGLDTSLAHVALSLSHRKDDEWATMDMQNALNPREEMLRTEVADSKPLVWWNVKYKNRWLSDGSVVSGNPIITNILWNEIGRGSDLHVLADWIKRNEEKVRELTTAVYQAQPPRITDFIPPGYFKVAEARAGEKIFLNKCSKCHGVYEKAWSIEGSDRWPIADQLKTTQVKYFSQTPVRDVGTDSNRYRGMKSLEQLNNLKISRENGILIESQVGYVPPPLEGIWARYPYLHNNSIPNLCELLKPQDLRVKEYWAGEAEDIRESFDWDCNGYPLGYRTPMRWQVQEYFYNARRKGMSNQGHDFGFSSFTEDDRRFLIRFLQTL